MTSAAVQYLGANTILIVVSDNGGSPWFGGLNSPLRGSKQTPYEGGVRVPALAVDLSTDRKYFFSSAASDHNHNNNNSNGRIYHGMFHISDWLPTILSFAGVNKVSFPQQLDGVNHHFAIQNNKNFYHDNNNNNNVNNDLCDANEVGACESSSVDKSTVNHYYNNKNYHSQHYQYKNLDDEISVATSINNNDHNSHNHNFNYNDLDLDIASESTEPRKEILLELLCAEETVFEADVMAYRIGNYKLVVGAVRDSNWYTESSQVS